MESPDRFIAVNELVTLREAIKERYRSFHRQDRLRFPLFEFNTNRTNYEPLRESFEEEFFVQRGVDRQKKTIHIPSTTTLSLLFTDDSYVPTQKIWNTCWSYAERQSKAAAVADEAVASPPTADAATGRGESVPPTKSNWLLLIGIGLLVGLLLGVGVSLYLAKPFSEKSELAAQNATVPNRLAILHPYHKGHVPSTFVVNGLANPNEIVWIVTHFQDTKIYWVQFPALVDHRGFWVQAVKIAGAGFDIAGRKHEIRALVNPVNELKVNDVLSTWPKAERSTGVTEIIIDPKAPLIMDFDMEISKK